MSIAIYNDEEEVLATPLRLLSEVVDRFATVFLPFHSRGHKTAVLFPMEIVTSLGLAHKVRVIELGTLDGDNAVATERFSRDPVVRDLDDAAPVDLVVVSDLDEIPRRRWWPR